MRRVGSQLSDQARDATMGRQVTVHRDLTTYFKFIISLHKPVCL